jgi:phenylacetate-CoA ligase
MSISLVDRTIAELFYRISRPGYARIKADLIEREKWPVDKLRHWQLEQIKPFLKHCYENVPFYSERFEEAGFHIDKFSDLSQIESLPLLTKTDIRSNYDKLTARGYDRKRLYSGRTGGSTGEPTLFYMDTLENAYVTASHRRYLEWYGIYPGDRSIHFGGQSYVKKSFRLRVAQKAHYYLLKTLSVSVASVTNESLDEIITDIKRYKPKYLDGYPSGIYLIGRRILETGSAPLTVRSIMTSSEVLQPHYRTTIREAFGVEPYDTYGGGDTGIAYECRMHQGLHTEDNSRYIELVNESGKAATIGEYGRVVVTTFYNYAWPYVRYDMGDLALAIPQEECQCGVKLPKIGSIQGRTGDLIQTMDGRIATTPNFTLIFANIVNAVKLYQIVQNTINEIEILVVPTALYNKDTESYIASSLRTFLGDAIEIRIIIVDDIMTTPIGKRKIVISNLKTE